MGASGGGPGTDPEGGPGPAPDSCGAAPDNGRGTARPWPVLGAVSAGGALGALTRYAALLAWPAPAGAVPWVVLGINVLGSALIGVLMVLVAEGGRGAHPLVRPFLGVGVLGGFTSFSTYAMDMSGLLGRGAPFAALLYGGGTLLGALAAVWAAAAVTRRLSGDRSPAVRGRRTRGRTA
ncbi:CrcB family protein [Streptomyces sp. NPDC091272]|uniref:FluC/FEX family fluoride channel n=1 Tax=Streptomyces sp. NPDC091272 TaxID=3365981 RepID=UPI00382044E9